jgi:hypothetical protein
MVLSSFGGRNLSVKTSSGDGVRGRLKAVTTDWIVFSSLVLSTAPNVIAKS